MTSKSRSISSRLKISWQPLRRFGTREAKLRLTLPEGDAIEKPQAVHPVPHKIRAPARSVGDEVTGAVREPLLLQEMQEVALHLPNRDLIGAPPIKLRQPPDRLDVRLPGTDRHPTQDHIVFHLLP